MKSKVYIIEYELNDKIEKLECSVYSLEKIKKIIENQGGNIINIISPEIKRYNYKSKIKYKESYLKKYQYIYSKYRTKKIDKNTFEKIINDVRKLAKECKSKDEFEMESNKKINENIKKFL